ncbi:MAG TPA: transglycosylase domain-containing protein [Solirubrobacteraceae bacterium]|nr:transglycosylase domain-containing protein [Solirubrobacteraceae bacterium]
MSRHARQRRRRHNIAGPARLLLVGGGALAAMCAVGAIAAVAYVLHVADTTPKLDRLHPVLGVGSSQVYAADGTRLGFIQADDLRSPISWSEIPANLKHATVAIEDQRFYHNDGIDLTGIFRSAVNDALHGQALQGASTITMQLVRNLYLGNDLHTLKQKITEAKLALEYNEHHSKRSILTSYLNTVPYGTVGGQTALGVQAASRVFFDKPASQLDLPQTALLAGLPQAPSEYNPFLDPHAARRRRNTVLAKMAQLHYITQAQASAARAAPLEVRHGDFYSQRKENFFFEYVREQLEHRYGRHTMELGGLRVYTTIDLNMQRLARKAIAEVLDEPEDPASAIVTIDPHNGYIEAMAESESYEQSQFNLAADGHRQPGSTFKAIDLADALSRGVDPNSTYYLSHTLYPGWLAAEPNYEVKTFEGTSLNQEMNLVTATLHSDNTVYAQLAADLGEESITHTAYAMGVKTHLLGNPGQALGGLQYGVTPLEMADVYATLADGGYRNAPIAITKVVFPDSHVDANWGHPHRVKVLPPGVTGEETRILHQNVLSGTAGRSAIGCPTAAKTGTTSELYDAWLDGYNSEYATAVWMGYPKRDIAMTDVHGEPQQGGYLPAEIWHTYMQPVTEGHPCAPLDESNEGLTFKPFFGHFATTGRTGGEAQAVEQPAGPYEPPTAGGSGEHRETPANPIPRVPTHPHPSEPQTTEPQTPAQPEVKAPAPSEAPQPETAPGGGAEPHT